MKAQPNKFKATKSTWKFKCFDITVKKEENKDPELKRDIYNMVAEGFGYPKKTKYDYYITFKNLLAN